METINNEINTALSQICSFIKSATGGNVCLTQDHVIAAHHVLDIPLLTDPVILFDERFRTFKAIIPTSDYILLQDGVVSGEQYFKNAHWLVGLFKHKPSAVWDFFKMLPYDTTINWGNITAYFNTCRYEFPPETDGRKALFDAISKEVARLGGKVVDLRFVNDVAENTYRLIPHDPGDFLLQISADLARDLLYYPRTDDFNWDQFAASLTPYLYVSHSSKHLFKITRSKKAFKGLLNQTGIAHTWNCQKKQERYFKRLGFRRKFKLFLGLH